MAHSPSVYRSHNLDEWRDWLCDKEMPIFSHTVRRISATLDDAKTGAAELAQIVMTDPNLSAKVLKVGDSAYYNPSRQTIDTLTKAITLLGYNVLSELALTACYIESIQSVKKRGNANREIADALHAAVQAKSFAVIYHDPAPEEVFLAALLYNIGHLAFWCFDEQIGENIEWYRNTHNASSEEAETKVLGFSLRDLGAALAQAWHLKGLIKEVHVSQGDHAARIRLVRQAHEVVRLHNCGELNIKQCKNALAPLHQLLRKSPMEMLRLFRENTRIATAIASRYGVENARVLMQAPRPSDDLSPPETEPPTAAEATMQTEQAQPLDTATLQWEPGELNDEAKPAESAPDECAGIDFWTPTAPTSLHNQELFHQFQQKISSRLSSDFDLNALLDEIVEAIQYGLPMDRALLALLNRERNELREKTAIGWPTAALRFPVKIPLIDTAQPQNLFTYAMKSNDPVWVRPDDGPIWERLYTPTIKEQIGQHECFIAPLALNNRPIGVLYADRELNATPLDQQNFNDFCYLALQATFGLKLSQLHT